MKRGKLKELLWFVIPFLLLSGISIACLIPGNTAFIGIGQYLRLLINDPLFFQALYNTFVPPIILSVIVCVIYQSVSSLIKIQLRRRTEYVVLFLLSLVSTVIYTLILTHAFHIMRNTVHALQVGIIVTLIVWLAEPVKEIIRRHFLSKSDHAGAMNNQ